MLSGIPAADGALADGTFIAGPARSSTITSSTIAGSVGISGAARRPLRSGGVGRWASWAGQQHG
jgi:hypothetical protein